jgi:hypothetical protein
VLTYGSTGDGDLPMRPQEYAVIVSYLLSNMKHTYAHDAFTKASSSYFEIPNCPTNYNIFMP